MGLIDDEGYVQSSEAKALGANLVPPALFPDLDLIVPLYPLQDVIGGDQAAESGIMLCCYSFAVCFKECVRFVGFVIYYFVVVPARYISVFVCQPSLDSKWRCYRPCVVAAVLFVKPVLAIVSECCIACQPWIAICNRGASFKGDMDSKQMQD